MQDDEQGMHLNAELLLQPISGKFLMYEKTMRMPHIIILNL